MTVEMLKRLLAETYRSPARAARGVLDLRLPLGARWLSLALVAVVITIIAILSTLTLDPATRAAIRVPSPFVSALIQAGVLVLAAGVIHLVGQATGGRGSFPDALILMVWLQAALIPVQLAQVVAQAINMQLAQVVFFGSIGLFFWFLTSFVAELQGYRRRVLVLLGIIVVMAVMGLLLAPLFMPYMTQGV